MPRRARSTTTRGSSSCINRLVNCGIRVLFRHGYNDTTNAFKAYRREVIESDPAAALQPLQPHGRAAAEGDRPRPQLRGRADLVDATARPASRSSALQEMGSRYLFIVLYVFLEHHLSRGDYRRERRRATRRRAGPGGRAGCGAAEAAAARAAAMPRRDRYYERLYEYRFRGIDQAAREAVWAEIAPFIWERMGRPKRSSTRRRARRVHQRGARPKERWAVDRVAYDAGRGPGPDIELVVADVMEADLPDGHFDGVFVSNFLEHLRRPGGDRRLPRSGCTAGWRRGGRIAIMGPNYRYCSRRVLGLRRPLARAHPRGDRRAPLRRRASSRPSRSPALPALLVHAAGCRPRRG